MTTVDTQSTTPATLPDATKLAVDDLGAGGLVGLIKLLNGAPGSATVVRLDETVNGLKTDGSAVIQPVSAASLPLPAGASTSGNQVTEVARLDSILAELLQKLEPNDPVIVSASALPSGASTGALQTTGNTSLSSIDTKTPALGQALAAASTPVVLTAAQLATLTPPAAITGFATEVTLALLDTDLKASLGSVSVDGAATGTVMDLLYQLGKKLDAANQSFQAQAALLTRAFPVPVRARSTLLHNR